VAKIRGRGALVEIDGLNGRVGFSPPRASRGTVG
jgi:hypothetical protein